VSTASKPVLKILTSAGYGIREQYVKLAEQAMTQGPKGTKLVAPDETVLGTAKLHVARTFERACQNEWVCGFGLALAEMQRRFGQESTIAEVCKAAGLDMKKFKDAGLDEYDLKELRKCLK
jgi:hypothetical protein